MTIPNDVRSPEDLDDVLATIGTLGIDVLKRQPKLPSSVLKRQFEEEVEPGEDLSEHTLEEIGLEFAVTRERIRQIEAKALRKLRQPSLSGKLRLFLDDVHE